MQSKNRGESSRLDHYKWIFCGLSGILIFLVLVFLSAVLSNQHSIVFARKALSVKLCLAVSALLCGWSSARSAGEKRFLFALAGEGVLFIFAGICALSLSSEGGVLSFLIDAGIMLFGAFAGTLFCTARKFQRSGKR